MREHRVEYYKSRIFCTLRVPGFHFWPNPPEPYKYLGVLHRHEFHIRLDIGVRIENREIEFIELKHMLSEWLDHNFHSDSHGGVGLFFGGRSCEMIAVEIAQWAYAALDLPRGTKLVVEVSEDGENGAVAEVH